MASVVRAFLCLVAMWTGVASASVHGVVRDAGGQPIAGVQVVALFETCVFFCSFNPIGSATTDAAGQFAFVTTPITGSSVVVIAGREGYASRSHAGVDCFDPLPSQCATEVEGSLSYPPDTALVVDFTLTAESVIVGNVRAAGTGEPVVAPIEVSVRDGTDAVRAHRYATSAADGTFRIGQLRAGAYAVTAGVTLAFPPTDDRHLGAYDGNVPCDGVTVSCDPDDRASFSLAAAAQASVDFDVMRGGMVRGRVTSAGNGARVSTSVEYLVGTQSVLGNTDSRDGAFSLGPLLPATVRLRFGEPFDTNFAAEVYDELPCTSTACDIAAGVPVVLAEGARIDIDEALHPLRSIRGRVVDAATGTPLAGVTVSAGEHYTNFSVHFPSVFDQTATTATLPDGRFVLNGFEMSQAHLVRTVAAPGHVDVANGTTCTLANAFCEAGTFPGYALIAGNFAGDVEIGDLALPIAGSITGRVALDAGPTPAVNRAVYLIGDDARIAKRTRTGDDGTYRFDQLPAGDYRVLSEYAYDDAVMYPSQPCPFPSFSSTVACDVAQSQRVPVTAGAVTSGIDFARGEVSFADGFERID